MEASKEIPVQYHSVSVRQFIVLYFATLGFYPIYWFYKNWFSVSQKRGRSAVMAIFSFFFCYSMFKRIATSAKKLGYQKSCFAGISAFLFIALSIFTNITMNAEGLLGIISFFIFSLIFILFIPSQKAINYTNNGLLFKPFSLTQKILISFGMLFYLFLTIMTLYDFYSITWLGKSIFAE